MIKIAALGAALALAAPAQAKPPAADAAMKDFFANTLVISVGDFWQAKRYLAADHTYRETGTDGDVHGTWSMEDGKMCIVQANAGGDKPSRFCNVGPGKKVGEIWEDRDPYTGNTVMFELTPGR